MFHWICPECGREIAPQAKECPACEPAAAAPALQPSIAGAPKLPAPAIPLPMAIAGRTQAPIASGPAPAPRTPLWQQALPPLEPAKAPRIAQGSLREPGIAQAKNVRLDLSAGPESAIVRATLPALHHATPAEPPLANLANYAAVAASQIRPAGARVKPSTSAVKEQSTLPGPTLPHELTSLNAAGIAKILLAAGHPASAPRSSWMLSMMVAAAVLAGTLGTAFYAMPGLANSPKPAPVTSKLPPPVEPERPAPSSPLARIVEVTGIRFVTDVPGRPPQIHYLVVNHSNVPLMGVTVNVTLRINDDTPLSQFAFRAPKLGPYESKEMVSTIERFNREIALPNWHELRAEVQIAP